MTLARRDFLVGAAAAAWLTACSDDDTDSEDGDAAPSTSETPTSDAPFDMSSDEDLSVGAETLDSATTPDSTLPQPTAALITRWRQDPFARGSYSYLAAGASPRDRATLRADVDGRLFFAGEATSQDYPSTVHGALLEGRAAATRIMDEAEDDDEIAIIGAGMAGLAAARVLTDEGFSVFVLEARERIGGRMHTDDSLGFPIDLGAAWIHGADGNPLVELVDATGTATHITDPDDFVLYDSNGDEADPEDLEEITGSIGELDPADERTLADIVDEELEGANAATIALANYAVTTAIEHEYAGPLTDMTPLVLEEGEEFGGEELAFPAGYASLLAPLVDGVAITTGQVVERITLDDDVVIGGAGGAEIRVDRVLVTAPLGVIKAGDIQFVPPLPDDKLAAIERLGVGLLNRVVLQFDERFWDDTAVIGFVGNEPGLFAEWYDLTEQVGSPVIVGFNAADVADALEGSSDAEIIAAAMRALDTMYGS